jgi:outer membrane protein
MHDCAGPVPVGHNGTPLKSARAIAMQFCKRLVITPAIASSLVASLFWAQSVSAQSSTATDEFPLKPDGDLGIGAYYTPSLVRGRTESATVLPYANFDYGRLFARIDTFGVKTAKMGYGYLELAGRVELDGFKANTSGRQGLNDRKNSLPLGIGTLQETPLGALYVNAFHDFGKSKGNLVDITYVVSLPYDKVTIYPQIGVEYLSKQYVGYYYGVSAQEAAASGYGYYRPSAALDPYVAAFIEARISDDWNLNLLLRHRWLDNSIVDSPIVGRKGVHNVFASIAYRFK